MVGVDDPDHPVRPPVRRHRAGRPRAPAAADAARPGQPRLLPHRGGRARDGRLRAPAGVVGAGRHPGRVRGAAAGRGLGPDGGADDERDPPRAGARDAADQEVLQRPRGLHARRGVHPRRVEVPGFWVAAGLLRARPRRRRRHRQDDGRVDRGRPAGVGGLGARHPPLRRHLRLAALHAGAHARGAVEVLRHQVPGRGAKGRPAVARLARLSAPRRARCRLRREVGLGARELVRVQRRRRRRVAAAARLGGRELVAGDRRRGAPPPGRRRACSTSRASPRSRSSARARSTCCSGSAPTTSPGRSAASPTRRCSTTAAASSATCR